MKLNWRELNHILPTKSEDEVLELLNRERNGERRLSVLERLHQRYTVLRANRERITLLRDARDV